MDKVNLLDNERLDIPDTLALQDLPYEYIARVLGGIFGRASGCLQPPSFTVDSAAKTITVGAGIFYHSEVINGYPVGYVLRHEASSALSVTKTVNYGPFVLGTVQSFAIWCKVQKSSELTDGNSDTENRKFWNDADASEFITSINTRKREVLSFHIASINNDWGVDAAKYFPVAIASSPDDVAAWATAHGVTAENQPTGWSNGDWSSNTAGSAIPTPRPIYVWDYRHNSTVGTSAVAGSHNLNLSRANFGYEYELVSETGQDLNPNPTDLAEKNYYPIGLVGMLTRLRDSMASAFNSDYKLEAKSNWVEHQDTVVSSSTEAKEMGIRQLYEYVNSVVGKTTMETATANRTSTAEFVADATTNAALVNTATMNLQQQLDDLLDRVVALETFKATVDNDLESFSGKTLAPFKRIVASFEFNVDPAGSEYTYSEDSETGEVTAALNQDDEPHRGYQISGFGVKGLSGTDNGETGLFIGSSGQQGNPTNKGPFITSGGNVLGGFGGQWVAAKDLTEPRYLFQDELGTLANNQFIFILLGRVTSVTVTPKNPGGGINGSQSNYGEFPVTLGDDPLSKRPDQVFFGKSKNNDDGEPVKGSKYFGPVAATIMGTTTNTGSDGIQRYETYVRVTTMSSDWQNTLGIGTGDAEVPRPDRPMSFYLTAFGTPNADTT